MERAGWLSLARGLGIRPGDPMVVCDICGRPHPVLRRKRPPVHHDWVLDGRPAPGWTGIAPVVGQGFDSLTRTDFCPACTQADKSGPARAKEEPVTADMFIEHHEEARMPPGTGCARARYIGACGRIEDVAIAAALACTDPSAALESVAEGIESWTGQWARHERLTIAAACRVLAAALRARAVLGRAGPIG
jgi:hypothetical protein